jgi:hypothetical protein
MYEKRREKPFENKYKINSEHKARKEMLMASDTMDRDFGIGSSCH